MTNPTYKRFAPQLEIAAIAASCGAEENINPKKRKHDEHMYVSLILGNFSILQGARYAFAVREDTHKTAILQKFEGAAYPYKEVLKEIGIKLDDFRLGELFGELTFARKNHPHETSENATTIVLSSYKD